MANGKRGAQHNGATHGIFAGIFLSGAGSPEAEEFHKLLSAAREAIRPANGLEEIGTIQQDKNGCNSTSLVSLIKMLDA
jgi:hypothetical protein